MKKRNQIAEKYKWNFESYYKSDDDWQKAYNSYSSNISQIKKYDGFLHDKKKLLDCFRDMENLNLELEALYIYAHCNSDVDIANTKYQAMYNKIREKATEQSVITSFIQPQLSRLDNKYLENLLQDKDFDDFSSYIKDILREKEHTLNENEEELLSKISSFSSNFSQIHSSFENADLKFKDILDKNGKKHKMNQSQASIYLRSEDYVLRENAYKELQGAYARYNNFLTVNYLGSVKKDVFYAKSRKFSSALEGALFYEQIEPELYQNLIKNVEENLSLNHKYFQLKKKLINIKTIKLSDIYYNPIKLNLKFTYEKAFNYVCDALKILGKDYVDFLTNMFEKRMIDVFPNENKRGGAYQTMATKKNPLVLTNFVGNYNDVSTLAHELGHAMHSVYSDRAQSPANSQYTIFLAEIASTVNEILLNDYFLSSAKTKKEKIFYLNEFLFDFYATVFRQTMFANFEFIIHSKVEKNEELSSKILNETYLNLVKKYFGSKVKILKEVQYEWSRIPHFYTSFYVYKYATGIISAINIVENLKSNKITVEDYKKFLSSGCTDTPTNLLKIVKVNYDSEEPFKVAFKYVENKIKEFEKNIKN